MTGRVLRVGFQVALAVILAIVAASAWAADAGAIRGVVVDPLGAAVPGATVTALRDGQTVKSATSDSNGAFSLEGLAEGRYQLVTAAAGFAERASDPVFVAANARVTLDVELAISALHADVLVTAAATDVSQAQTGASASVIDAERLELLGNSDLLEPLRSVPGVAVVQTGGRGAATSVFVRGGASTFNKVLIDGVPANDIGGAFDFGDVATTGVDRVEVLRGANSVMFGSDAMSSVINITTPRGQTRTPLATFSIDGGNLGTSREAVSIGGAVQRVDYFGAYSHLQTDNAVENNDYRNDTVAGRFGLALGANARLNATIRAVDTEGGTPNAIDFYGIGDDSRLDKTDIYTSVSVETRQSDRWQTRVQFGHTSRGYHSVNPTPTGLRSDPSDFANFLGDSVTITGANGYSVTGRAILDYSGDYPQRYDSTISRNLLDGTTDYQLSSHLNIAGGARLEHEAGTAVSAFGTDEGTRTNGGAFAEARMSALGHLFVTAGLGVEHNEAFGTAVTPRVSAAVYLRPPSTAVLGDTKVTFNAGKGVKAPSISQELNALSAVVPATLRSVDHIGPERSRTIDVGVEQGIFHGRGRLRAAYFDNEFDDLIEYVSASVLPQLGVPADVARASGFGAYVNAQSNRARGVEIAADAVAGPVKVTASYTFVDAVVTKSFSGGVLSPAENPAFPGILIGQYSPLVGERPFRRPANSGSLLVSYVKDRASVALAGYFFGRQDDSTFLSDQFFGYSMLLPNQDLDAAYQKFDISGAYRLHPRLRAYVTIENAFDEDYEAGSGFPALPRTFRIGATVSLGGK